jgi:aquaporin Z
MNKYLTEFIGTFFLCLTVTIAITTKAPLAAIAIGGMLMVMVYMGGHISGAHYNPAVSLAVLMRGKMEAKDFLPYLLAQFAAGISAGYLCLALTGHMDAPAPSPDLGAFAIITFEILYTFALALVVLNSATAKETEGNSFYGLAIGFTVAAAAASVGSLSGGALNPAVGVGLGFVKLLTADGSLPNLIYYLVGPMIGGALAAVVFQIQHPMSDNLAPELKDLERAVAKSTK